MPHSERLHVWQLLQEVPQELELPHEEEEPHEVPQLDVPQLELVPQLVPQLEPHEVPQSVPHAVATVVPVVVPQGPQLMLQSRRP